jgi:hypothetical protein
MTALRVPIEAVWPKSRETRGATGTDRPRLILHRCTLDYDAALREHLRGGCAARVAKAAGSRATSRRNLRRVGLKIVARLPTRLDLAAALLRAGLTADVFARSLAEATKATKRVVLSHRGTITAAWVVPDWHARHAAWAQWLSIVLDDGAGDSGEL